MSAITKPPYQSIPEWGDIESYPQITVDFLPKPQDLVFRPAKKKVTIELDETTIEFFKKQSVTIGTPYQRIIRTLLNTYAKKMASSKPA